MQGAPESPYDPIVWSARPLTMDDRYHVIYGDGLRGQKWTEEFKFDRLDDGAFRIKLHSDYDGLLITIALGTDYGGGIHPYQVIIDRDGVSEIWHHITRIAHVEGARFPRGQPAWVWIRFLHGQVWVGFGSDVGKNVIMSGKTPNPMGGGYVRFAIGKTGNHGAFELLEVQPLERRTYGNVNLRGGIGMERELVWPRQGDGWVS